MTLSAIRTRVSNNIQANSEVSSTQIDQWINDIQRRICRGANFFWMETEATKSTSDHTQKYALPIAGDSGWTEVDSGTVLKYKDEIGLILLDYQSHRIPMTRIYKKDADNKQDYEESLTYGSPKHYAVQKGRIYLYPSPQHSDNNNTAWTVVLSYYGFLADLSGDSSTNVLVTDYPEILEFGATMMAWRYLFEEDKADYWETKFEAAVSEMIEQHNKYVHGNIEEGMRPSRGNSMEKEETRTSIKAFYE